MTKWDDVYFRLSASGLADPRWNASSFGLQRTRDVIAAIKWVEKHDINKYNIQSASTAKLAAYVVTAIAGKQIKIAAKDFLPFDTSAQEKEGGPTDASLRTLRALLRSQRLDGRLIGILADEIKLASLRDDAN